MSNQKEKEFNEYFKRTFPEEYKQRENALKEIVKDMPCISIQDYIKQHMFPQWENREKNGS